MSDRGRSPARPHAPGGDDGAGGDDTDECEGFVKGGDRLRRMRAIVARNDACQWARSILESVASVETPVTERVLAPIVAALAPLAPLDPVSYPPLAASDASVS